MRKNPTMFVYGPQGCGKTRNARKLMRKFGLSNLIDGWQPGDQVPPRGTLILTQDIYARELPPKFRAVPFKVAMQAAA